MSIRHGLGIPFGIRKPSSHGRGCIYPTNSPLIEFSTRVEINPSLEEATAAWSAVEVRIE
jgi:hypothetical protein